MHTKIVIFVTVLLASAGAIQEGKGGYYIFDETQNGSRCTSDYQCDGARTCSQQEWCQGIARPTIYQAIYSYNESITDSKCPNTESDKDYDYRKFYCDGQRTCSPSGQCQGVARESKLNKDYSFNESYTEGECPTDATRSDYIVRDYFCDGRRACSSFGTCVGIARTKYDLKYLRYYDETITQSKCPVDNESKFSLNTEVHLYCDGDRRCVWGRCDGFARRPKNKEYRHDEKKTDMRCPYDEVDPDLKIKDYFCDGLRTCSESGWCEGTAR